MEGSILTGARARAFLREENVLVGRLERLRGEFRGVLRWNLPLARQKDRLDGLKAERDALVVEACHFMSNASQGNERITACVQLLNGSAEEAECIVSVREAKEAT